MFASDKNFTGTRGRNFVGKLQHQTNTEIEAIFIENKNENIQYFVKM
jgi:hypothetical protein